MQSPKLIPTSRCGYIDSSLKWANRIFRFPELVPNYFVMRLEHTVGYFR